jgi:chemotaxis protein CheD
VIISSLPSQHAIKITFKFWEPPTKIRQTNQYALENPIIINSKISTTQMSQKMEEARVDMAEMKADNKPIELVTSVGSCIAICLHDSKNRCGGLAHIMLPNSAIAPQELLPSKYADTAVPALITEIKRVSKADVRLYAKIAGGANMFPNLKNNMLNIGAKNYDAVKIALDKHNIRLIAEDVGGTQGRRINFNIETGVAIVRKINGETTKL